MTLKSELLTVTALTDKMMYNVFSFLVHSLDGTLASEVVVRGHEVAVVPVTYTSPHYKDRG